jgi:hypothetical protein
LTSASSGNVKPDPAGRASQDFDAPVALG